MHRLIRAAANVENIEAFLPPTTATPTSEARPDPSSDARLGVYM